MCRATRAESPWNSTESRQARRVMLILATAGTVLIGGCQDGRMRAAPSSPTVSGRGASTAAATPTASAASRGTAVGVFEVTCYTGDGTTSSGQPTSRHVVSVDRRVFPLGTRLFIDQIGARVAADTGSAIAGRHLEIWEPSAAACTKFGHKRLRVWRQP